MSFGHARAQMREVQQAGRCREEPARQAGAAGTATFTGCMRTGINARVQVLLLHLKRFEMGKFRCHFFARVAKSAVLVLYFDATDLFELLHFLNCASLLQVTCRRLN